MKLIFIAVLYLSSSCNSNRPNKVITKASFDKIDTIIDPIQEEHYDIQYKNHLKITPDCFPVGIKGYVIIELLINKAGNIGSYKIVRIKINRNSKVIYEYKVGEKITNPVLSEKLNDFIKTIKTIPKRNYNKSQPQLYNIVVRLE